MMEKIYTIPVNEAFDASCGCPFCTLYKKLEENELDIILGASMMEPDVRIKTNESGFCATHYTMMMQRKNRLGLALMLESHLDEVSKNVHGKGLGALLGAGNEPIKDIQKLEKSCYVCSRIDFSLEKMFETAVLLWESETEFQIKLNAQPYFCLPHYRQFLQCGKNSLHKKKYPKFYEEVSKVTLTYFDSLQEDISWFCKKFDYRNEEEPWGNSKDAVERAIRFLAGVRAF